MAAKPYLSVIRPVTSRTWRLSQQACSRQFRPGGLGLKPMKKTWSRKPGQPDLRPNSKHEKGQSAFAIGRSFNPLRINGLKSPFVVQKRIGGRTRLPIGGHTLHRATVQKQQIRPLFHGIRKHESDQVALSPFPQHNPAQKPQQPTRPDGR